MILQVTHENDWLTPWFQVDAAMASRKRSWGVMLSSCMRGYDGDDISHEHIDQKNKIQVSSQKFS
jgi:hypothetical protein